MMVEKILPFVGYAEYYKGIIYDTLRNVFGIYDYNYVVK